ncbi:TrmO family methyltransferase domain-containing protein [Enterococcus larvae]|uniref:TrmO family methyltransferase domain-containing protein n=1 Tax=Enterococcus larvae TaxID=2794352 RepID=UPI003F2C102C
MSTHKLIAIGTVHRRGDRLVIELKEERLIAALKHLSLFSHGTLIFSDGAGNLLVRVAKLEEVDEKKGQISLAVDCGLLEGNVLYDIKPYMPCEDRIAVADSDDREDEYSDKAKEAGGFDQLDLSSAGTIRKKQNRYFLYPEDFEGFVSVSRESKYLKVLWWFSRFDKKEYRRIVQGEPPYEQAPRNGIFATRSPVRPNPIALTVVQIISINQEEQSIEVAGLDCFDKTPLVGIRPYIPSIDKVNDSSVPSWLAHWPNHKAMALPITDGEIILDDRETELLDAYLQLESLETPLLDFDEQEIKKRDRKAIAVYGARQNNLKNVHAVIPKEKIVAVAGVSGSGKSSFAFDTLYAESRLRLSETMDSLEKPEVDTITGLPPAVAIAQRSIGRNPRSTVGTFTGIQDRLRLLYAAIGHRHCPKCGKAVRPKSRDELVKIVNHLALEHKLKFLSYRDMKIISLAEQAQKIVWETYVDQALDAGKGAFYLVIDDNEPILLQTREMCYHCETILFEMSPAVFSFNNPESMCGACNGLGKTVDIDPALVVAHPEVSLLDGASDYWGDVRSFRKNPTANWMRGELLALADKMEIDLEQPWIQLPEEFRQIALYGSGEMEVSWSYVHPKNGRSGTITRVVEGAIPVLNRLLKKGGSTAEQITASYMQAVECPVCQGERLAREGRMVTVAGLRYPKITAMTVTDVLHWVESLPEALTFHEQELSSALLKDIHQKTVYLKEVGLAYLTLDRTIPTLSGGELQRLKLVAQMGIGLSGLLYVMDEPTAGLHPRDYPNILHSLHRLKEEGNTILVVEHEETVLQAADWLLEFGPGAGQHGGELIWQGDPKLLQAGETQTAQYLTGRKSILIDRPKLSDETKWIQVEKVQGNNLKEINVQFPKGYMTCITGVSGSGKSTLAEKVLIPAIEAQLNKEPTQRYCQQIIGAENIQQIVYASQASIVGNKRSILATFIGLLDELRPLFASLQQAKEAQLSASAFSFNSKEGQCDACKGEGIQTIAVPFSADIAAVCPLCHGKRYKNHVLAVHYEGKNIFEVLELQVEEALLFFEGNKKITAILQTLCRVGLGYLKLGQGIRTLSGGESQRMKLARVLCKKPSEKMLYVLDEPTSGLHFSDIQNLLELFSALADAGHTVLIIEHNKHVIRNVDWVIDLGPEGGDAGGNLVVQGTPQTVMACDHSYTGAFLKGQLQNEQ